MPRPLHRRSVVAPVPDRFATLRRHLTWALLFKLALLALLFALFFSPAHQPLVGPGSVSSHLHLPR